MHQSTKAYMLGTVFGEPQFLEWLAMSPMVRTIMYGDGIHAPGSGGLL